MSPAAKGRRTRLHNADLIALTREGRTTTEIAAAYGINPAHVVTRLRDIGLDSSGQPIAAPEPPPRALVVNWQRGSDESWRDDAACFNDGHDKEMWFAEGPGAKRATEAAKAICGSCPVRLRCLEFGLRAEAGVAQTYRFGIVGGLTVGERMALGAEAVA